MEGNTISNMYLIFAKCKYLFLQYIRINFHLLLLGIVLRRRRRRVRMESMKRREENVRRDEVEAEEDVVDEEDEEAEEEEKGRILGRGSTEAEEGWSATSATDTGTLRGSARRRRIGATGAMVRFKYSLFIYPSDMLIVLIHKAIFLISGNIHKTN